MPLAAKGVKAALGDGQHKIGCKRKGAWIRVVPSRIAQY
jgi:hypothetical protein